MKQLILLFLPVLGFGQNNSIGIGHQTLLYGKDSGYTIRQTLEANGSVILDIPVHKSIRDSLKGQSLALYDWFNKKYNDNVERSKTEPLIGGAGFFKSDSYTVSIGNTGNELPYERERLNRLQFPFSNQSETIETDTHIIIIIRK